MSTIVTGSELLQRALRWISDERRARPQASTMALVEDASIRFNLSPAQSEWLMSTLSRPPSAG